MKPVTTGGEKNPFSREAREKTAKDWREHNERSGKWITQADARRHVDKLANDVDRRREGR